MEREFPILITEELPGKLNLYWDDLWLTARARSPLRGEGLCKLWLTGDRGKLLLGTMIPEQGCLRLCRRLSLNEIRRAGVWPPTGVEAMLVWKFELDDPFPRTDLFCFAKIEKNRLSIRFDRDGQPLMPEGI